MEGHSSRSSWATTICSRIGCAVFICREIAGDASIDLARGADRSRQDRRCHRYLFCTALTIRVSGNIWLPSNSDPLPILPTGVLAQPKDCGGFEPPYGGI